MEKLHLFTNHGVTYTFINIVEGSLVVNESVIAFSYKAMSDSNIKEATFFVRNLAGFTVLK